MTGKRIIFSGRVQGVGFRYTAHRMARQYAITGYVRNLPDGSVEMFAQGPDHEIDQYLREIRAYFSTWIRDCQIREIAHNPGITDFRITY